MTITDWMLITNELQTKLSILKTSISTFWLSTIYTPQSSKIAKKWRKYQNTPPKVEHGFVPLKDRRLAHIVEAYNPDDQPLLQHLDMLRNVMAEADEWILIINILIYMIWINLLSIFSSYVTITSLLNNAFGNAK